MKEEKHYLEKKYGIKFDDERINFCMDYIAGLAYSKKELNKIFKKVPQDVLALIAKGQDVEYHNADVDFSAVFSRPDDTAVMSLKFTDKKHTLAAAFSYGLFAKDVSLVKTGPASYFEFMEKYNKQSFFRGNKTKAYSVLADGLVSATIITDEGVKSPWYFYFPSEKMNRKCAQLPHTKKEYNMLDEQAFPKKKVEDVVIDTESEENQALFAKYKHLAEQEGAKAKAAATEIDASEEETEL